MPRRTSRLNTRLLPEKFRRAARQRLTSAYLLLAHGMSLDAVYLGGYVAECALKALILKRTPASRRRAVFEQSFRGAAAHDFERMKAELKALKCVMPSNVSRTFAVVVTWSTDLRYEVGLLSYNEAERFLTAATDVLDWVNRSW